MSADVNAAAKVDIEHLAKLSRLHLSDEEKLKLKEQLEHILEHFRALEKVDVSGVEPTAHATAVVNVWEEDIPQSGLTNAALEAIAPAFRNHQVVVPKVVDDA